MDYVVLVEVFQAFADLEGDSKEDFLNKYFGWQIIPQLPQLMDQWHGSAVQDVMQIVSIQSLHDYQEVVLLFGDLEGER